MIHKGLKNIKGKKIIKTKDYLLKLKMLKNHSFC